MRKWLRSTIERYFYSRITGCTALRVVSAQRVTPHMLRVTFFGSDLEAFATNENLHVKLLLPPEGAPRDRWLDVRRGGKARVRVGRYEPVFRKYTIRRIDAASGRLAIDFVLHADGGPGAAWATAAQPGDLVGILGLGGRGLPRADWYLIAGDETALPAIGRMSETMVEDAKGIVLIEVENAQEEQDLYFPPGVELRWLHRRGGDSILAAQISALSLPVIEGSRFAWAAAEFSVIQSLRATLRHEHSFHKDQILAVAYWRQ